MSQRLTFTIDHLVGLPAPPPPVEFTRRVLLRRAFIRCALSEVTKENPPPQASQTVSRSPCHPGPFTTDGRSSPHPATEGTNSVPEGVFEEESSTRSLPSSPSSSPWCHHRAEVRLTNFKMRVKKKKKKKIERENDAEMTIGAGLLEILVPAPPPLPRPPTPSPPSPSPVNPNGGKSHDFGPSGTKPRDRETDKRPYRDTFSGAFQLDRETLPPTPAGAISASASPTLGTAGQHSSREQRRKTWAGTTPKNGDCGGDGGNSKRPVEADSPPLGAYPRRHSEELTGNEPEEEQRDSSGFAGGAGIEADPDDDDEGGHNNNMPMTRIITINSFRFQKSLEWHLVSLKQHPRQQQQQQQQQPSSPDPAAKPDPISHGGDREGECIKRARTKDDVAGVDATEIAAPGVDEATAETCADEREAGGGRDSLCRERFVLGRREDGGGGCAGGSPQSRIWSQMGIEIRAGHVAMSLPPRFQLGDLQVAALLQWKGIQEALGDVQNWS